ncbi:MAG: shikimate dehydrogenase [Actinobacteria bacterium]|nr:MAG: shikimate dehydrogenase [Actinomycetota bacterium]
MHMARINGKTKLAGVVGNPLGHSLSPAMHNAVYEQLGLDWVYVPLEVKDEMGLRRFFALAPSLPFVGFNITMPFKQAAMELCDEVAMAANMAGAVNAVHVVDGRLVGYNTDGRGLLEALQLEASFEPAGKDVVIVGAGGAAGAAFVAFLLGRAASVTVVNRDPIRADELVERLRPNLGPVRAASTSTAGAEEAVRTADLIVNATPAGMRLDDESPIPVEWVGPGQVVYDMVYGRTEPTRLVAGARQHGATAIDGLGMLVCQGATAVDIWNDSKQTRTPRETMRAAAEAALAARRTEQ